MFNNKCLNSVVFTDLTPFQVTSVQCLWLISVTAVPVLGGHEVVVLLGYLVVITYQLLYCRIRIKLTIIIAFIHNLPLTHSIMQDNKMATGRTI